MNRVSCILLFIVALQTLLFARGTGTHDEQGSQASQSSTPALLSTKICGKGVYLLSLGGSSIGRETFDIECRPDGGYRASGNTSMSVGAGSQNLNTTLELDKEGLPQSVSVKGTSSGTPYEQSVAFKDDKAVVTTGTGTREVPYANHAAVLMNSSMFLMQFIAGRYDSARGGEQTIALFPDMTAVMKYEGRDEVGPNTKSLENPTSFYRYSLKVAGALSIFFWADSRGRLAVIYVPTQKFMAVREEAAPFAESLRSVLMATDKTAAPDYSAPATAPFTAEEVRVEAGGFKLAGTLLLPKTGKRPFAAVVMSTGSGQQTRDEAIQGLEKYRPFRQIAEYLASRGIAVLRADDRGVGDSGGMDTLQNATTFDFADDVRSQIAYLRTRPDIDGSRIAVIGHSEGGVIAPLVAASDPRLAAIVLMAGTAKRGEEVLRYQFNYAAEQDTKLSEEEKGKVRAQTEEFLRAIRQNGDVSKFPAPLRPLSSPWGRAFLDYDPLTTIRKVRQPVLILQGALDRQVTAEQARLLEEAARKAGNRDVTVRIYPNLNHLFLPATSGMETEYEKLQNYSLGQDLLEEIADWLVLKLKVGK
jgi:fermentation-respiration switch protein FrsA (DUF1100 family)